jgi:hypothetical protein
VTYDYSAFFDPAAGQVYHAVVEFAPYQRIPLIRKPDPRHSTINEGAPFLTATYSLQTSVQTPTTLLSWPAKRPPNLRPSLQPPSRRVPIVRPSFILWHPLLLRDFQAKP